MTINLEALSLPMDVADKGFKTAIAAAVAGTTALVAAMGLAVKATFQWADQMDSLQDITGASNETAAAWNFTLRKSGVATETLARGLTILNKGLITADGKLDTTGKSLKAWGINVLDSNKQLKDQETLLGEVADKYASLGTQQEKVNFLTEVFGKSGAELIDFFDTLAADGGIDAVTKKVKELGLAIDPNRYEQFSRNLEEMKLMGLGLAVGFTEAVMPALESLSQWVFKSGIPALKKFGGAIGNAFQSGGVLGVVDFLLDAFDDIDWNAVSMSIAEGINSIDWQQVGIDFSALVTRIKDSLVQLFGEIDLMVIGQSLGSALNNAIAGAFGVEGGEEGLQALVQAKLAELTTQFQNWAAGAPSSFDALDQGIMSKINSLMNSLKSSIASGLANAKAAFVTWAAETLASLQAWGAGMVGHLATWGAEFVAKAIATLNTFEQTITNKLRDIAKAFFGAAQKWANQAAEGFLSNMDTILDAVSIVVGEINSILKKIISSFKLSFGGVNWGSEGGGSTGGTKKPPLTNVTCFPAGTLIAMSDGTQKPIEAVQKGDVVVSWHEGTRTRITAGVSEIFSHTPDEAPQLVSINGRLFATPEHLIYTAQGWKRADELNLNDTLLENGAPYLVFSLGFLPGHVHTYNLHTSHDSHNYFANGLLVHNAKDVMPTADIPALATAGNKPGGPQMVFIMNWNDMDYPRLAGEIVKATNNA